MARHQPGDKKPRRQRGEGSLYQRKSDGMWVGSYIGRRKDGTKGRCYVYDKSQKGAQRKLNKVKLEVTKTGTLPAGDIPYGEWLHYWLSSIIWDRCDPSTYRRYKEHAELHIIPVIGDTKVRKLTTDDIRQVHRHYRHHKLSASSVAGGHRTMITSLNDAMSAEKADRNVAALVDAPRVGDPDPKHLSLDQFGAFMAMARRNPRTWSRWISAFQIGPRQGETLGLRLDHIDWDERTVDIAWQLQDLPYAHGCGDEPCGRKRTVDCPGAHIPIPVGYDCEQLYGRLCLVRPKNAKHEIPIPDLMYDALVMRHEQVKNERENYVSDHRLVWCRPDGEPIAPEDDYDEWVDWLAAAEIPHVKLHAARSTAATLLRAMGYPLDIIQKILGHSTAAMTQGYTAMDMRLVRDALAGYSEALANAVPALDT